METYRDVRGEEGRQNRDGPSSELFLDGIERLGETRTERGLMRSRQMTRGFRDQSLASS